MMKRIKMGEENRCSNCEKAEPEEKTRIYGYGMFNGTKVCFSPEIKDGEVVCAHFVREEVTK